MVDHTLTPALLISIKGWIISINRLISNTIEVEFDTGSGQGIDEAEFETHFRLTHSSANEYSIIYQTGPTRPRTIGGSERVIWDFFIPLSHTKVVTIRM